MVHRWGCRSGVALVGVQGWAGEVLGWGGGDSDGRQAERGHVQVAALQASALGGYLNSAPF